MAGVGVSMTVSGDAALLRNLTVLGGKRGQMAVEGGVFEWAEDVLGDAKELAPVDLGFLRNSGFALTKNFRSLGPDAIPPPAALNKATSVNAVIGFSAVYALIQHERTDFNHKVGQAKYLEQPAKAKSARLPKVVAARVQREVVKLAAGR